MLSKEMLAMLNEQIAKEAYSSNLYLAMSSWCHVNALSGAGNFLGQHADEELAHMKKIFNYVLETGSMAQVSEVPRPPQEFSTIKELFDEVLKHEQYITQSINDIVDKAFSEKDFMTFDFLQWFVSEQREEETLVQTIVDKINLIGLEGQGLYHIDKEIQALAAQHDQETGSA